MKIGLFGGTFNPPHYGHIHIAQCFAELVGLAQVTFLPAGQPYHKEIDNLASDIDRLIMTHLASKAYKPYKRLSYSNIDMARKGNTYTIDSVMFFRDYLPLSEIWILVGFDAVKQLPTWKNVDAIMDQVNIAVAPRYDGSNISPQEINHIDYSAIPTEEDIKRAEDFTEKLHNEFKENHPEFYKKYANRITSKPPSKRYGYIYILPVPTIAITSSDIRNLIQKGESITGLVPKSIENFIKKHGLYYSPDKSSNHPIKN